MRSRGSEWKAPCRIHTSRHFMVWCWRASQTPVIIAMLKRSLLWRWLRRYIRPQKKFLRMFGLTASGFGWKSRPLCLLHPQRRQVRQTPRGLKKLCLHIVESYYVCTKGATSEPWGKTGMPVMEESTLAKAMGLSPVPFSRNPSVSRWMQWRSV